VYRFLLSPGWLGRLAGALALAAAMTMLGLWQLDRYEDRTAINARIDAADPDHPAALAAVLTPPGPGQRVGPAPPDQADWSMIEATGRYDPANEILVRGRTVAGRVGVEVLTPLVLPDGSAVLVDRGWVPPAATGAAGRPDVPPAPAGEVTVVGRVRPSERGGGGTPERRDGTLSARRIHLAALADQLPYPLYGGYLRLEVQRPPADPGLTPLPVRHERTWMNAGYAGQWWIFAGLVLAGFGWLARREAHREPREPRTAGSPAGPITAGSARPGEL
jgi:cytochrome oxidase assembly protein ShyY1